jgi:starch synthase
MGYGIEYAKLWEHRNENLTTYFIEFNKYFARNGIYSGCYGDHHDNPERFAFMCRSALDLCYFKNWIPDIIHCHDWTTGLISVHLCTTERNKPLGRVGSVFTIHNIQHHGLSPRSILAFSGIPDHVFRPDGVEAVGLVNMMKAGIYFSKKLTTVSRCYSKEIQTPDFGFGLDNVLKFKAGDLIGICNGIDTSVWNPETDRLIPANYSKKNLTGKLACKMELQKEFCLEQNPGIPIFAVVSRLAEQKGLDILVAILPHVLNHMSVQFVILGNGEFWLESRFNELASIYGPKIGVYVGFDEKLSHLVMAGSDFIVIPSRFEPCGLTQMYAMRYGTLPVAHQTGGLSDTIENYDKSANLGTGFLFSDLSNDALYNTIGWACATYYDDKIGLEAIRFRAMQKDFSWKRSAEKYIQVYHWARQ